MYMLQLVQKNNQIIPRNFSTELRNFSIYVLNSHAYDMQ